MLLLRTLLGAIALSLPLLISAQRFTDFQVHDQDASRPNSSYSSAIHSGLSASPVMVGRYESMTADRIDALLRYGASFSTLGDFGVNAGTNNDVFTAVTEVGNSIVSVGETASSSRVFGLLAVDVNGPDFPQITVSGLGVFDLDDWGFRDVTITCVEPLSTSRYIIGGYGCHTSSGEQRGFVTTFDITANSFFGNEVNQPNIFVQGQRLGRVDHILVEDNSIVVVGQVYDNYNCLANKNQVSGARVAVQRLNNNLQPLTGFNNGIILAPFSYDLVLDAELTDNGNVCVLGYTTSGSGPNGVIEDSRYPHWLWCSTGFALSASHVAPANGRSGSFYADPIAIVKDCENLSDLTLIGTELRSYDVILTAAGPSVWNYSAVNNRVDPIINVSTPANYNLQRTTPTSAHRDETTGLIYIGMDYSWFYNDGEFQTHMAYLVYDSEDCEDCIPEKDYTGNSYNGRGISYLFRGNSPSDLEYRFFPDTYTDYTDDYPWLVEDIAVSGGVLSDGQPFIDYDFSGLQGTTFEVCYPVFLNIPQKEAENCPYEYRCEVFCIDDQPENLAGVISCPNCQCSDSDGNWLPSPFACEDFDTDPDPEPLPLGIAARWTNSFDPVDLRGIGFGALNINSRLGNDPFDDYRYQLFRGNGASGIPGRVRISFAMRTFTNNGSAGFRMREEDDQVMFTTLITTSEFIVSIGEDQISWPVLHEQEFEVAMIFEQDDNVVEFWLDRNFLGSLMLDNNELPAALNFTNRFVSGFSVDNICVRTISLNPLDGCPDTYDPVCTPSGEEFDNACAAQRLGLYAPGEYENCFTICDQGGPLISRLLVGEEISGTTFADETALAHLYSAPCVDLVYDGNIPEQLYADVYLFENDDGGFLNIDQPGPECGDARVVVFSCDGDGEGGYGPTCISPVFGEYALTPFERYYFVVLTEVPTDYCFSFSPNNRNCTIEDDGAFVVENRTGLLGISMDCDTTISIRNDFIGASNNFQLEESGDEAITTLGACYDGFRDYNLSDRVYSLQLPYPAYLSLDLEIENRDGIAGVFIYRNICGTECMTYFDTQVFETTSRLDSVRVPAGTYYFVVDQELPVDSFFLDICVRNDLPNSGGGIVSINSFDVDSPCLNNLNPDNEHDFSVVLPLDLVNATTESILSTWYNNPVTGRAQSYPQGSQVVDEEIESFDLPNQPPPDFGDDSRCGFEINDQIRIGLSNNNGNLRSLRPTAFVSGNNQDRFQPGGESRVLEYRLDTSYFLAMQIGQLVLNTSGNRYGAGNAIPIATNIGFRIESDDDWLTFQDSVFSRETTTIPFTATALTDGIGRSTKLRVIAGANDEIRQEIDVVQRGVCQEANLAVASLTTGCIDDFVEIAVSTGIVPAAAYEFFLDGVLVPQPLMIRAVQGDQTYQLTIRDLLCNEEARETFTVRGILAPEYTETLKECNEDLSGYQVEFTSFQATVELLGPGSLISLGNNGGYRVSDIPSGESTSLAISNEGCTIIVDIEAPECECATDDIGVPVALQDQIYVCPDDDFPLLSVSEPSLAVAWFDVNGTELARGQNSYQTDSLGSYFAAYLYDDGSGCVSTDRTLFRVIEFPALQPSVALSGENLLCVGETLNLIASIQNPDGLDVEYFWDGEPGTENRSFANLSVGRDTIIFRARYAGASCSEEARFVYTVAAAPEEIEVTSEVEPCSLNENVYAVGFRSTADTVWVSAGELRTDPDDASYFEVVNIPGGNNLTISAANYTGVAPGVVAVPGCSISSVVEAIDCSCDGNTPDASFLGLPGDVAYYCTGDDRPVLRIAPHEYTAEWYGSDGALLDQGVDTLMPPVDGPYTVRLVVDGRPACDGPEQVINVSQLPEIELSIPPVDTFCEGDPIMLTAAGSWSNDVSLNFSWDGVPGTGATTIMEAPSGSGSVTLEAAYADYGCGASVEYAWYVVAKPTIDIPDDQDYCGSDEDFYTITFTAEADTVLETTSNGTLARVAGTTNEYRITGIPVSEPIVISAVNNFGRPTACIAEEMRQVDECNCPSNVVSIPFDDQTVYVCAGDTPSPIVFPALEEGFAYYVTDPEGNGAILPTDVFSPTIIGNYTISVQAVDRECLGTTSRTIEVVELTAIQLAPLPEVIICAGSSTIIRPEVTTGSGPEVIISWPDGSTGASYPVIAPANGSLTVPYTARYQDVGCPVNGSVVIRVPDAASVTVDQDFDGCANNDPTLYDWAFASNADEVIALQPNRGTLFPDNGRYLVENVGANQGLRLRLITVLEGVTCFIDTTLMIEEPCECNSNAVSYSLETTEYSTCPNTIFDEISFPDPGEGFGLTITTPDGTEINRLAGVLTFRPVDTGRYEIQIRNVVSNCLSEESVAFFATFSTPPVPIIDVSETACLGETLNLSADQSTGIGTLTYGWNAFFPIVDVDDQNTSGTPVQVGITTVSLTVTDENDCSNSVSVNIDVQDAPNFNLIQTEEILCFGDSTARLQVEELDGASIESYEWTTPDMEATVLGLPAGEYGVTVTSAAGCNDSAQITITQPPLLVLMDTIITPDRFTGGLGSIEAFPGGGTPPYTFAWFNGGTFLGVDSSTLINQRDLTNFQVQITDANGCVFRSGGIDIPFIVRTSEPLEELGVKVYPNPVGSQLTLDFTASRLLPEVLEIRAADGRLVRSVTGLEWAGGRRQLDVSGLAPGTYILHLRSGARIFHHIIIKQ